MNELEGVITRQAEEIERLTEQVAKLSDLLIEFASLRAERKERRNQN